LNTVPALLPLVPCLYLFLGVWPNCTISRLASRHFWAGVELRTLAHGSTFFCGWSGIAFNVDWYSWSSCFLYASLFGSTGGLSPLAWIGQLLTHLAQWTKLQSW